MKVYKQVAHVSRNVGRAKEFVDEVANQVNEYQNKNMKIEIQYSTCANEETVIYSALILAYTEE